MSIFDRFVPKDADRQKSKSPRPAPYSRASYELDEAGAEAKERYPDDSKIIEDFVWALKAACKDRRKKALEGTMEPMNAQPRFFLSRDRLCAYACVLPPENGGSGITLEHFLEDMHYEGILYGVLKEEIPEGFARGYYHIFPVARGKAARAGEDGRLTELFQRRRHMGLEVQNGSEVDFSQDVPLQPVRKGAVICLIRQPRAGTDGMDVTGAAVPAPKATAIEAPRGENVELGRGGQALVAGADGILYIENDRFCIHAQKIIDGDLNHFQGTLEVSGNLYIGGDVDGGVNIVVSGDVVINGKVGQAQVESTNGIIRVQKGVYGTNGKTCLKAASQVQTPVVEYAQINAGASVIAETILNSVIRCDGTVYAMTGRGMIANSTVQAGDSILCLRIGNLAGGRSFFSVGYPPHIPEARERLRAELAEAQSVVEKLWDAITTLRKKGGRISDAEKSVMGRLVQQRELYLKRLDTLKAELRNVNQALEKKSKGRIRCEKLYPFLDVQIGRLTEEIITIEENCNIHAEDNSIVLE